MSTLQPVSPVVAYEASLGRNARVGTWEELAQGTFRTAIDRFSRGLCDDAATLVEEKAEWGYDDRQLACRVLLGGTPSARVEHRRPGADANPYIVADALLAADLLGKTFLQSYATTRRAELERFEQWTNNSITEWELSRHLEHQ